MNNAKLCLCFVLAVLTVNLIECKGGHGSHGGGHSSHGGHSSGGHSSGGHSSGGHSTGGHSSGGGGWSFFGWGKGSSSSSSSSHTYPKSPSGYSGHGTGGSHSYPYSPGFSGTTHYGPSRPTYYTAPQYVYVTRYREAPSPYSDMLTGLTMYNLGRSHHYHHHYYNDDYHRSSSSGVYSPVNHGTGTDGTNDEAKCVLKIKKDWKLEVLKIPCAIVSTFDNGNRTSNDEVTNTPGNNCSSLMNMNMNSTFVNGTNLNNASLGSNTTTNITAFNPCVNQTVDIADPLSVTGAPIAPADASSMECSVEITTKLEVIRHNIECSDLLKYAKMAVPEDKVTNVLPAREKLKSMLDKPPWWLSLFIAV